MPPTHAEKRGSEQILQDILAGCGAVPRAIGPGSCKRHGCGRVADSRPCVPGGRARAVSGTGWNGALGGLRRV